MDHHTGHTAYGASSNWELGPIADAIAKLAAHLPALLPHVVWVWFVVEATVDKHLLLRIARQPLHKATATSLGTRSTAALDSPLQPSPLRPTSHRETGVQQAPIQEW